MTIRPMLASDIDRVLEITDNLAQASRWAREVYETAIRPGSAPRRVALVAEEPALGIVGFTVACVVTPEAELETIGVTAAQQRSGIGRQLLGETKRILGGLGVTKVLLEVRESNRAARQLYKAAGFDETGRRASYYVDPKEDAIVMSLKLAD